YTDLLISSVRTDSVSVGFGRVLTVQFAENNAGNITAGNNKVFFYLSPDGVLTPDANGDILLGEYDITTPIVNKGSTGVLSKAILIPCTVMGGLYSIFVVADKTSLLTELD